MSDTEQIKIEMIRRFGDAYKAFGLNKLMGHIVALLIFSPKPVSLDGKFVNNSAGVKGR
ncbi:MAG: hypothetical protein IPN18_08120 [Ignavibacteriales bacterium]|nr:hypothetical protein [Ignavibacteriales bacterium]